MASLGFAMTIFGLQNDPTKFVLKIGVIIQACRTSIIYYILCQQKLMIRSTSDYHILISIIS
jgi:hypothetical protein